MTWRRCSACLPLMNAPCTRDPSCSMRNQSPPSPSHHNHIHIHNHNHNPHPPSASTSPAHAALPPYTPRRTCSRRRASGSPAPRTRRPPTPPRTRPPRFRSGGCRCRGACPCAALVARQIQTGAKSKAKSGTDLEPFALVKPLLKAVGRQPQPQPPPASLAPLELARVPRGTRPALTAALLDTVAGRGGGRVRWDKKAGAWVGIEMERRAQGNLCNDSANAATACCCCFCCSPILRISVLVHSRGQRAAAEPQVSLKL